MKITSECPDVGVRCEYRYMHTSDLNWVGCEVKFKYERGVLLDIGSYGIAFYSNDALQKIEFKIEPSEEELFEEAQVALGTEPFIDDVTIELMIKAGYRRAEQ